MFGNTNMLLFVPRTKIVSNFGHSSIWHAPCKAKDKPPRQGWQIFEGQNFEGATTMTTAFKNRKTFSAAICAALLFEIGRASCRERVCQCRSRWSPYH